MQAAMLPGFDVAARPSWTERPTAPVPSTSPALTLSAQVIGPAGQRQHAILNGQTEIPPPTNSETYRNASGETITLVQRIHTPNMWEMRRDGEWIGAADYLGNLQRKLERNGYRLIETETVLGVTDYLDALCDHIDANPTA